MAGGETKGTPVECRCGKCNKLFFKYRALYGEFSVKCPRCSTLHACLVRNNKVTRILLKT